MGSVRPGLSRWFLPFLGLLSGGVTLVFIVIDSDDPASESLLEGLLALVLAGGLIVVGYRFYTRTTLPDAYAWTVGLWALAGGGLLVGLSVWFLAVGFIVGEVEPQFAALTLLTAGVLGGTIVGIRTAVAHRRQAERVQALSDYEELFEKAEDGISIHDPSDGTILEINTRGAELYGYAPEELRGKPVEAITADDPRFDQEVVQQKLRQVLQGESQTFDWLAERKDGSTLWVEVSLKRTTLGEKTRLIAFLRDISERKVREKQLERAEKRFRSFAENTTLGVVSIDETSTVQYANPGIETVLGYEPAELTGDSLTRIIPERLRDPHERGLDRYLDEGTRTIDWSGTELPGRHADGHEVQLEVSFGELTVGDERLFTGILRDITERKRHERQIRGLHDAMREMVQATDTQEVAEIALRRAEDLLSLPITTIWLVDETGDRLEPLASTDTAEELLGEMPVFTEGNSLSWHAYTSGEMVEFDDLRDHPGRYNPDTPIRSELIIPLGEYGVMNAGSTETNAFTDNDLALARLLAANVEVALDRAERETQLERQTDRMEFFNSILRHDVLNGITVIKGRAEFLADDLEGEQGRDAETIVQWSDDITEIVQRVRTIIETLTDDSGPELEPTELTETLRGEVERVAATYPEVSLETTIAEGLVVQANELLGEVLGNVVTNAIEHNDTDALRIRITAEATSDEFVTVRVADNGQGISEDETDAVFRRGETGHAKSTGSGFGLFFVDAMVEEYGGTVDIEHPDDGGATFVLTFPTVQDSPHIDEI